MINFKKCIFAIIIIVILFLSCNNKTTDKINKEVSIKKVAILYPVQIDAFVDYINNVKYVLEKDSIEVISYSGEGDVTKFTNIIDAAIFNNSDIIISVGTQLTDLILSDQYKNERPIVLATCITDPKLVEGLKAVNIHAPRKEEVAILLDSPRHSIFSQTANVINDVVNEKKVGIIFNKSEVNSYTTANRIKENLIDLDFSVIDGIVSNEDDVIKVAKSLILQQVAAIIIPHDKFATKKLPAVVKLGIENSKRVPVFSLDDGNVKNKGASFGVSVNYGELGKISAHMIQDIVKGQKASNMEVLMMENASVYINKIYSEQCGLVFPQEILNGAIIYE